MPHLLVCFVIVSVHLVHSFGCKYKKERKEGRKEGEREGRKEEGVCDWFFFNPTIEVVTFREWCMLGVLLAGIYLSRT